MGTKPASQAWEARNKSLKTLEFAALSRFAKPVSWKMVGKEAVEGDAANHPFIFRSDRADLMSEYSARRASYVGAEPTGERGLVNSSGGKA